MNADTVVVPVELGERAYDIVIGHGTLPELGAACAAVTPGRAAVVISDDNVAPLYADAVLASLRGAGFRAATAVMPAGEEQKHLGTVSALLDAVLAFGVDRRALIVALGGGVVGDVAGFVAAVALRGLRYAQVPTTIIAQVDSSVGGKTGVDHPRGKNLIGAFHQPALVYVDTALLATLNPRETRAGLAEVIKYGFIQDARFLEWVENNLDRLTALDPAALRHAVRRSCELKADVVRQDERETTGLRAIFNFGHTTGHAVEAVSGYTALLHGEAVAVGMVGEAEIARRLGRVDADYVARVIAVCARAGLPIEPPPLDHDALIAAMRRDKKNVGGSIAMTLPDAVGHVSLVTDVDEATVRAVLSDWPRG